MIRNLSEFGTDLTQHVEPAMVQPLVRGIRERVGGSRSTPVRVAVELHRVVAEEVEYYSLGPGFNRPIRETWERGGNCVDQSVLMMSMFIAAGLDARLVTISKSADEGHMLPEVRLTGQPVSSTTEQLHQYSTPDRVVVSRQYAWETDTEGEGPWFIADPVCSDFIGDITALREEGYVENSDNGWTWTTTEGVQYYVE